MKQEEDSLDFLSKIDLTFLQSSSLAQVSSHHVTSCVDTPATQCAGEQTYHTPSALIPWEEAET